MSDEGVSVVPDDSPATGLLDDNTIGLAALLPLALHF
jgi:hypothetical protein